MKIELHAHSREVSPCGYLSVEELIRLYKEAGYDALVIANHFSRKAMAEKSETPEAFHALFHQTLRRAERLGREAGLLILGAYELRFDLNDNDYLVYGMTEEQCRDCEALFSSTPEKFGRFARENGILFYQAHPFRNHMTVTAPEHLFGIEVRNTHPRHDSRNDIALAWAEKFGLHQIGGSDCHRVQDVGTTAAETEYEVKNSADLLHVLKNDLYKIV